MQTMNMFMEQKMYKSVVPFTHLPKIILLLIFYRFETRYVDSTTN